MEIVVKDQNGNIDRNAIAGPRAASKQAEVFLRRAGIAIEGETSSHVTYGGMGLEEMLQAERQAQWDFARSGKR